MAKPFLKWAGGKTQLLPELRKLYPAQLLRGEIKTYIEPFLGGGAVLFDILSAGYVEKCIAADVNKEVIACYLAVRNDYSRLAAYLRELQREYFALDENSRSTFFYEVRELFNSNKGNVDRVCERCAQLIFLNKTCFNGLFRLNKKGGFNVPFGKYKNPTIFDEQNLEAVSQALACVDIVCLDFESVLNDVGLETFIYYDPPYRPLSKTASFTSYSEFVFDDEQQKRLAAVYKRLDRDGIYQMLSNSDPKNENASDDFFEELYAGYSLTRVKASRAINCDASKRGLINELVIMNYIS